METKDPIALLEEYLKGTLSLEEVCSRLKIHRSTLWRKCRRLKSEGPQGLTHRLKGRRSNRAIDLTLKETILKLWSESTVQSSVSTYSFHRKLLRTMDIKVSYSTLLRWLSVEETAERSEENPQDSGTKISTAPFIMSENFSG